MQAEEQIVEMLKRISEDLHAIRRHTNRLVRDSYRHELERIASTPERQEIWRLCDGTLSTEEIAKRVGISVRTVQYFVQEAEKAGLLVSVRRSYSRRTEDYDEIPSEWKPYKKHTLPKEVATEQSLRREL